MLIGAGGAQNYKAQERERVHPCNVCDKAFKSLAIPNQHNTWPHIGHVLVCKDCCNMFKTYNNINRHKKLVWQTSPQEELLKLPHVGQGLPTRRLSLI